MPTLQPGHRRSLDNRSSRKVAGIREMIEAVGASLQYLPPYSPDLNPIEQLFAKLKALLRKAAARTLEALVTATANALAALKPDECANYRADSGYRYQLWKCSRMTTMRSWKTDGDRLGSDARPRRSGRPPFRQS